LISKVQLLASRVGRCENVFGMPVIVKARDDTREDSVIHEVKRVGYLIDRYVDLTLRIGDTLVVYICKSAA